MITQISMKATGWCKPDPNNPRKAPDDKDPRKAQWEKDLDRLGDDLLGGRALVPLLIGPGFRPVRHRHGDDGHPRPS